tara:strand:+ start:1768 stop:1890 length:123 start_codon:yes stop_codon:yes gene_type:complete
MLIALLTPLQKYIFLTLKYIIKKPLSNKRSFRTKVFEKIF